jgi:hypothetical protein
VPAPRIDDVLYQLDEVEVCERQLGEAIRARAPLEEIEAIVKRKKTARPK